MNLFSGLKGEGMNKVQPDLEKFAEEFKQLCEKYNVYVYSNFYHNIVAAYERHDGLTAIYLKGDHVG